MTVRSSRRRLGILALLALFLTFAVAAPPVKAADEGGTWQIRHPGPWQQNYISALLMAGDQIKGFGRGTYLESADGKNWTATPTSPELWLYDVVEGAGVLVGVDMDGLYSSADGINWTQRVQGSYDIDYLGDRFLAYGAGGLLISENGSAWTAVIEGTDTWGVAYGDGRYVATGNDRAIFTSADGRTWEQHVTLDDDLTGIAYGDGLWVAHYWNGNAIAVSSDGINWDRIDLTVRPVDVLFGNGLFMVEGETEHDSVILTSTDGRTWTMHSPPRAETFMLDKYQDGDFLAFSSLGYYRSPDGVFWEPLTGWRRGAMTNAAYGQGRWVATGQGGVLVTSPDGVTWTERDLGTPGDLNAVVYAEGRFIAVGNQGIWSSPTGLTWTLETDDRGFNSVAYGGGQFLALGLNTAWYSPDGLDWTKTQAPKGYVAKVAYGNGKWVAVGSPALLPGGRATSYAYVSEDGRNWTTVQLAENVIVYEVAHDGDRFAAVGNGGHVFTSIDGLVWTDTVVGENVYFNSIIADEGQFLITGHDRAEDVDLIAVSDDAESWYVAEAPAALVLTAVADGRTLGLGYRGQIFDLIHPERETPACKPPLADVSVYNPACQAVQDLFAAKIVQGRGTQGFVPEGQLSRAEFATMLVRAMGWTAPAGQKMSFSDLKQTHWAYQSGAIQAAVAHGAFSGFPDGTFKPDQAISRSELVKIAAAVAGLKPEGEVGFTDVAASDWFRGWVAAAEAQGLIGAEAGGGLWADPYFHGREAATRNEAALLLWNLMNRAK